MPTSMRTPSRRMTLGHMPSSQNRNRRQSVDPSSIPSSAAKSRRPPRGRKSMIPSASGRENLIPPSPGGSSVNAPTAASRRRQSVGGPSDRRKSLAPLPPPQIVKPDPRPINDKAFQQQCIKQLLGFLLESGYQYPISRKSLSRPSAKDFSNICTFMLRLVDPNFQMGTMKFEDEVTLNFKCIGYPYTVSKTALVAAGALHTWPALLAALSWLMNHIKAKKASNNQDNNDDGKLFESLQELEIKSDKAFFRYLGQAYTAFMRNDAQMTEQLESGLADRFDRDDGYLAQEVERVTDLNAAIVERINALAKDTGDLPTYAKKREDYATDLEQFHDLIRQMNDHKTALEQKINERTAELAQTNDKLQKMNAHVVDLKKTIESQELSVDDIQTMESEMKGVSEAMDRALDLRDKRRKTLLSSENELMKACSILESTVAEYNATLSDLQLVPRLGSALVNVKATLNKAFLLDVDHSKIVGVDLETKVRPAVETFRANFTTEIEQTKTAYQDSLDKVENSSDECKAARGKLRIVQDKIAKCEKTLESEQKTHSAKLAVRQREVDAMESKVAARRDPVALEEQMAAYERQCVELEALRLEHQEINVNKKKLVQDEIQQACKLMVESEKYLEHKLRELDDHWNAKEARMGTAVVPSNVSLHD